jgi:tripartite-type tricarboxylate transporter receptor subunit TctC
VIGIGTAPRLGTPEEFAAAIEEQRARIAAIHQASDKKPAQ